MSKIILVHGAFNELWGPHELHSRWAPAVQDGLWHHGVSVDPADISVCFYGDLFRLDLRTLDREAWQEHKAGAEDLLADVAGDRMLDQLGQAAGEATLQRTVHLMAILDRDPDLFEKARSRLAELVSHETRAVVAHSLGTIIAYRTLAGNVGLDLHTFVTLGSPLGNSMVGDFGGTWPGSVQKWVNVAAEGDMLARPHRLADIYGDRVEDYLVDNGHRAHSPEPYLNSRPTGAALARALTG